MLGCKFSGLCIIYDKNPREAKENEIIAQLIGASSIDY